MSNIFKSIFNDKESFAKSLEHYSITPEKGFLAYYTQEIQLSPSFQKYVKVYQNTFQLLQSGTFNEEIENLSYDENELNYVISIPELTKIFSMMTVITNCYLYINKKKPSLSLPSQLAVPLYQSSQKLNILPVFNLWSTIHGVKKIDDSNTYSFDNLKMRFSFTNTTTEEYFFKTNLIVNIKMNRIFEALYNINHILYKHIQEGSYVINTKNINQQETQLIKKELFEIKEMLNSANKDCSYLFLKIDSQVFFHKLRPFLYGYSQFPNGVFFEGVNQTFSFTGASAGQDPYNMLLKAIIGISYFQSGNKFNKEYENSFKKSIRKDHLNFINLVEKYSLIKYLQKTEEFKGDMDEILKSIRNFYQIHNGYVSNFIEKPAKSANMQITGSGGSSIKLVKSLSHTYYEKSNNAYQFIDDAKNIINLTTDKNKSLINVHINIDSEDFDNLKILAKFTIEDKIQEVIKKEELNELENRILIIFHILNKNENLISKMIVDGIKSIIEVLCCKNIYTKKNIITILKGCETSEIIIEKTIEFLLSPGISKVMHSSVLDLKNKTTNQFSISRQKSQKTYTLVTGGTRGIGGAASRSIAEEGHNVLMTGRKKNSSVQEFTRNLEKQFKIKAQFCELDIGDHKSINQFVKFLKDNQIYLRSVIHNAGVGSATSKEQMNNQKNSNHVLIEVNSIGTLLLQNELEKAGILLNPCRILIVNSVGGVRPFKEFNSIDLASKAVLNKLAESLSNKKQYSVVSVYPGATNTDMFKKSTLDSLEKNGEASNFIEKLPKKSIIEPSEIGKIISFFIRDEISMYTNGSIVQASCGMNIDYRELPK